MEGIWKRVFIKNMYSSIRCRGIHKCANDLYNDLQNNAQKTKYCLKLDIRKFYPSIDHDILYSIIQKKIKDKWLYKTLNKRHLPYSFKYEHSKFQYKTKRHRTTW